MLDEVDRYIRECNITHRTSLVQSASDVFDGSYDRKELDDLIKHRILEVVKYNAYEMIGHPVCEACDMCGDRWTVDLTDKAMRLFWPDRIKDGTNTPIKRRLPRASVRKRRVPLRNVRKRWSRRSSHN